MNAFDLIIIGGGSAAFAAAIKANDINLSTLMVNAGLPLGGTCVNIGCVPSKFLIRAGESMHRASFSPFNGIALTPPKKDFAKIIQQKKRLVADMQQRKYIDLLTGLENLTVIEGAAEFVSNNTISVNGAEYKGLKIIIATGSTTSIPSVTGLDEIPYLTSETLFDLEDQPESLIILGAGYIALEIAQAYRRLGTDVTILQRSDRVLSKESQDITDEITFHLKDEGIAIHTGTAYDSVKQENGKIKVEYTQGRKSEAVKATHLLVATGIRANTQKLKAERINLKFDEKGRIMVNDYLETNIPNIYAIGDVTNLPAFVYTAAYEGGLAVTNAFQGTQKKVDFTALPWVVFTDPQVAGVGINEHEAEAQGIPHEVTLLPLTEVPRSIVALDTRGFIKLIRNPETDLLLGARIVAPEGSELTLELSLAIKHKITVKELAAAFHPYLTLSEGVKLAAMSFTTDVKKMSCCAS